MSRYFLDTGVLVGLTFLHDLWHDEAERLFATDNSLYTSQAVVYEYCNSTDSNLLEEADVDWHSEKGRFGDKLAKVRAAQMNLDLRLRNYDDEELDLETLVDAFIEETGIEDRIYPPRLIDEYIRPNITAFLKQEVDDREITCALAREAMDALCDTVQEKAHDARDNIRDRVTEAPEREDDGGACRRRLDFVDGYVDKVVLCDAGHLQDKNILDKVVTSDKSHMYGNREQIEAVLGIRVLYIKDAFADHPLPTDPELGE